MHTLTIPGSGQATVPQPGATNRLIVVSPNLVARYRAGIFEPYVGVGPGIFLLHTAREPNSPGMPSYSQSSTSVGLNTQVGLRAYVAEHISLFGEWKYNYFHVNQAGQAAGSFFGYSASVNLHHLVFGVGVPFLSRETSWTAGCARMCSRISVLPRLVLVAPAALC